MRPFPPTATSMQHLTIVTTGGTIDKIYFDDKSDYKMARRRSTRSSASSAWRSSST